MTAWIQNTLLVWGFVNVTLSRNSFGFSQAGSFGNWIEVAEKALKRTSEMWQIVTLRGENGCSFNPFYGVLLKFTYVSSPSVYFRT